MSPLPERQSATIGGRTLTWREAGSGPVLALVHGIGGHSGSWSHQFSEFASTHRVIAWDAPGYGGSDPLPMAGPRALDYAGALSDFLKSTGVTSGHLVGHSLGAIMIASLCHEGLFRPGGMMFLQPVTGSGGLPAREREQVRQSRIADMKALGPREFAMQRGRLILSKSTPEPAVSEAIDVMMDVPEAGYLAAWEMMCAEDLFALLEADYATTVVCGSDDPVSPPQIGRTIAERIPGAAFHCIDGVGHYASIEDPGRLNALLRTFATSA